MDTVKSAQFLALLIGIGIFLPGVTAQLGKSSMHTRKIKFLLYTHMFILGCHPISILSTTFYTTAVRLEWSTNICALSYMVHQFVDGNIFAEFTVTNPVTFILLPRLNCSYNNIVIQTIAIPAAGLFPDVSTNFTIGYNGK